VKRRIEEILKRELNPKILEVKNNSDLHFGHLGDDGSGETHFLVKILSNDLLNLTNVEAHRKINNVLNDEFKNGLHALEIKILKNG
jgi:BolA protein